MSSAIEIPGFGKLSRPIPSGPQSLITHSIEAPPRRVSSSRNRRAAPRPADSGRTHWYCVKPRGPYIRFQWPMASSG